MFGGNRVSKKMAKEVNEEKQGMEAKIEAAVRSRLQHVKENAEYVTPHFFLVSLQLFRDTTLLYFFVGSIGCFLSHCWRC